MPNKATNKQNAYSISICSDRHQEEEQPGVFESSFSFIEIKVQTKQQLDNLLLICNVLKYLHPMANWTMNANI